MSILRFLTKYVLNKCVVQKNIEFIVPVSVSVCLCVCVCVERERERERLSLWKKAWRRSPVLWTFLIKHYIFLAPSMTKKISRRKKSMKTNGVINEHMRML
jgi:hypothetical protein